jgi:hypothetical protein
VLFSPSAALGDGLATALGAALATALGDGLAAALGDALAAVLGDTLGEVVLAPELHANNESARRIARINAKTFFIDILLDKKYRGYLTRDLLIIHAFSRDAHLLC